MLLDMQKTNATAPPSVLSYKPYYQTGLTGKDAILQSTFNSVHCFVFQILIILIIIVIIIGASVGFLASVVSFH